MSDAQTEGSSGRPRLILKPRNPDAALKAEQERQEKLRKANPFGAAKPREAVLAERTGKSEEEIIEEAAKHWDHAKLRLSPQQLEDKNAAEAAINEIKEQITQEEESSRKQLLEEELKRREDGLEQLLVSFEKLYLEQVQRGEVQRPSERRQLKPVDAEPVRDNRQYERDSKYAHFGGGRAAGRDDDTYRGSHSTHSHYRRGAAANHDDFIGRGQYGGQQQDDFGSGFERRGGGHYGGGGDRFGSGSGSGDRFGSGFGHRGNTYGSGRSNFQYGPSADQDSFKDYPGMGPPLKVDRKYSNDIDYHSPHPLDF